MNFVMSAYRDKAVLCSALSFDLKAFDLKAFDLQAFAVLSISTKW